MNKEYLKLSFFLCIPIFISLAFSFFNFFINGYFIENYFNKSFFREYKLTDYYTLIKSILFILFSIAVLICSFFLVFNIFKYNFKNEFNYELLFQNKFFQSVLLLLIINKILILFSNCNIVIKYSQIFYLINTADTFFYFISFRYFFIYKKYNFITPLYFIIVTLISLLECFIGSIYSISVYTLIIFFSLLIYNFRDYKLIFTFAISFILIITILFFSRDFLRSSSFIKSDKLVCSKQVYDRSWDFAVNYLEQQRDLCQVIGIGSKCYNFFTDKLDKYKLNNTKENFYSPATKYNIRNFKLNFLSRYDFLRELNNYNIFIMNNEHITFLNGETYFALLTKNIPRLIYKDKPSENLGGYIPKRYGMMRYESSHSRPLNFFAESYINYSYFGALISPLILILYLMPYFFIIKLLRFHYMTIIPILLTIFNFQGNLSLAVGHIYYTLVFIILFYTLFRNKYLSYENL